jgi:pimeloyl-ACP methyl ester carboxylesterase
MSWTTFDRGGVRLAGLDRGSGPPVIFQHGLGGDEAQVAEVFPDDAAFRRLTLECRGQGRSAAAAPESYSIASFADDVLAFADARGVDRFVVGGISMGAAIALNIAVHHPDRVAALVLARPAWLWEVAPDNLHMYVEIARHLRNPDAGQALAEFEASDTVQQLVRKAPDNLVALRKFLAVEDREALASLLLAIATDGPGVSEAEARAIHVPTLVIGTAADVAHPLAYARTLAATIPGARLAEITPKGIDRPRYVAGFRQVVADFLAGIAQSKGSSW